MLDLENKDNEIEKIKPETEKEVIIGSILITKTIINPQILIIFTLLLFL